MPKTIDHQCGLRNRRHNRKSYTLNVRPATVTDDRNFYTTTLQSLGANLGNYLGHWGQRKDGMERGSGVLPKRRWAGLYAIEANAERVETLEGDGNRGCQPIIGGTAPHPIKLWGTCPKVCTCVTKPLIDYYFVHSFGVVYFRVYKLRPGQMIFLQVQSHVT